MAKAKAKGKPRAPKRAPFGGYEVCFKGCTDTLESLFGSAPMPPSGMTKRLWDYVKRHRLAAKGQYRTPVRVVSSRSLAAARHPVARLEWVDLIPPNLGLERD